MTKKCRVTLTLAEREELERLLAQGKADARKIKHAQILLKADEAEGGPAWPDARIAEAFAAGITTVERVRQRLVEEGFASALSPCQELDLKSYAYRPERRQVFLTKSSYLHSYFRHGTWTLLILYEALLSIVAEHRALHEPWSIHSTTTL